ncbi:MAG: aspartate kinase [Bacteroidota bacterium]|jgi:aspartate kinase
MMVFKFGGASVKDADSVRNVSNIIRGFSKENLVVVVSAMGKTTNALEQVVNARVIANDQAMAKQHLEEVRMFHAQIMKSLFPDSSNPVFNRVNNVFVEVDWCLEDEPSKGYDFVYDQIVFAGELVSTIIVHEFLVQSGINVAFADARDMVRTDNTYREGKVLWDESLEKTRSQVNSAFSSGSCCVITQGFIGGTSENYTTTLGREGSDYTAAILAFCMDAAAVYIWKDVQGVLNADPKHFPDAQKLESMSYNDAIELAYFGASVIHPKTIKPLENKAIPLHVKSFIDPSLSGTVIGKDYQTKPLIPSYIFKDNQMLISISAKDFSFIAEESLSDIFSLFAQASVKINLMQNSAISFSVCIDNDSRKVPALIETLRSRFRILYNEGLQLYTVRHYYPSTIESLTVGKEVLLEQRSRQTAQLVLRSAG